VTHKLRSERIAEEADVNHPLVVTCFGGEEARFMKAVSEADRLG